MAAVLATRVQRDREREEAQVERARERVAAEREAGEPTLPTAERVDEMVRAALAGHLGGDLTVRFGRGARSETVEFRLVTTLHRAGALGQTQRGCPVWLAYHDLYAGHAAVLDPPSARDAVGRAVGRLRSAAPRGDTR